MRRVTIWILRFLPGYVCKRLCRTCGHPVDWHDAGECWTGADGQETTGETSCRCAWLVLPEDPS